MEWAREISEQREIEQNLGNLDNFAIGHHKEREGWMCGGVVFHYHVQRFIATLITVLLMNYVTSRLQGG